MKYAITIVLLIVLSSQLHAENRADVKSLDATGDGVTLDTAAMQKAIDQAHEAGGGVVSVPAGKYLLGTILLKDNVTLHLDDNAELLGTADLSQYKTSIRSRMASAPRSALR